MAVIVLYFTERTILKRPYVCFKWRIFFLQKSCDVIDQSITQEMSDPPCALSTTQDMSLSMSSG